MFFDIVFCLINTLIPTNSKLAPLVPYLNSSPRNSYLQQQWPRNWTKIFYCWAIFSDWDTDDNPWEPYPGNKTNETLIQVASIHATIPIADLWAGGKALAYLLIKAVSHCICHAIVGIMLAIYYFPLSQVADQDSFMRIPKYTFLPSLVA